MHEQLATTLTPLVAAGNPGQYLGQYLAQREIYQHVFEHVATPFPCMHMPLL